MLARSSGSTRPTRSRSRISRIGTGRERPTTPATGRSSRAAHNSYRKIRTKTEGKIVAPRICRNSIAGPTGGTGARGLTFRECEERRSTDAAEAGSSRCEWRWPLGRRRGGGVDVDVDVDVDEGPPPRGPPI